MKRISSALVLISALCIQNSSAMMTGNKIFTSRVRKSIAQNAPIPERNLVGRFIKWWYGKDKLASYAAPPISLTLSNNETITIETLHPTSGPSQRNSSIFNTLKDFIKSNHHVLHIYNENDPEADQNDKINALIQEYREALSVSGQFLYRPNPIDTKLIDVGPETINIKIKKVQLIKDENNKKIIGCCLYYPVYLIVYPDWVAAKIHDVRIIEYGNKSQESYLEICKLFINNVIKDVKMYNIATTTPSNITTPRTIMVPSFQENVTFQSPSFILLRGDLSSIIPRSHGALDNDPLGKEEAFYKELDFKVDFPDDPDPFYRYIKTIQINN